MTLTPMAQRRLDGDPISRMHRPGVDPDSVLVIGDHPRLRPGTAIAESALLDGLADELVRRTGRGLDITVITGPHVTFTTARRAIENGRAWRFDAVLTFFGTRAAGKLAVPGRWQHQASALHDTLLRCAAPTATIVTLGATPTGHHGRTRPFHPRQDGRLHSWPSTTDGTADLAALLAEQLNAPDALDASPHARSARALRNRPDEELARQRALDALPWSAHRPEDRFQAIAEHARRLFGTESAEINLIDHDRQWKKAAVGADFAVHPRDVSICNLTIQHAGPTVIPDTRTDRRLHGNPLIEGDHAIRFYAAYPLESPDGYRVGALCVYDSAPRPDVDLDLAELREVALRAQAELWSTAGAAHQHE